MTSPHPARTDQTTNIEAFQHALLRADKTDAERILRRLMAENPSKEIVETIVVAALERIGRDWEAGEVALSQIYLGGKICEDLVGSILSEAGEAIRIPGNCAIALLNDYHTLGKRIVLSALRSAGFTIQDWGRMTPAELVVKVIENDLDVLMLSTLMLASALDVRKVKDQLDANGFKGKLLVGGAPFRIDKHLWNEVGADGTADNAMDSILVLSEMLERRP